MKKQIRNKKMYTGLGILQLFISIAAIPAGLGFILDPSGGNLGMTTELIQNSPFGSYLIPGIILFTVNGIGSLLGSFVSFYKHKSAGMLSMVLGLVLIIWIIAQVYWMGLVSWLQPFIFVLGVMELILAIFLNNNQRDLVEKNKVTI